MMNGGSLEKYSEIQIYLSVHHREEMHLDTELAKDQRRV